MTTSPHQSGSPDRAGAPLTAAQLRQQARQADVLAEQVQALVAGLDAAIASLPDRVAAADWGTDAITRAVDDLAAVAAAGLAQTGALAGLSERLQHLQAAVAAAEQLGARAAELGAAGPVQAFLDSTPAGDAGQVVETNPASDPGSRESAGETIDAFLEDCGDACPWGSNTLVMDLIAGRSPDIADAYTRGTLSPDTYFPEDQLADLAVRLDEVFQDRRDRWCARHGLTGEQLVGLTLVDDAGHELAVTAVRRDDDLRWAIIGTITCPGCGSLAHGPVQENVEAAWATDEELQARYVYGWELPHPTDPQTDPQTDLGADPSHEAEPAHPVRDDQAWLYQGLHGTLATRRLRVWRTASGQVTAVVTEAPTDDGTSITNAIESVIAQLRAEYPDDDVEVIEHYLPRTPERQDSDYWRWTLTSTDGQQIEFPPAVEHIPQGSLDRVTLDARGNPVWQPITPAELARRIGWAPE